MHFVLFSMNNKVRYVSEGYICSDLLSSFNSSSCTTSWWSWLILSLVKSPLNLTLPLKNSSPSSPRVFIRYIFETSSTGEAVYPERPSMSMAMKNRKINNQVWPDYNPLSLLFLVLSASYGTIQKGYYLIIFKVLLSRPKW